MLYAIFEQGGWLPFVAWFSYLAVFHFSYRKLKHELFMLAGACFSFIVVTISLLGKYLLEDASAASFFILAIVLTGLGAVTAIWLKKVQQEWSL